MSHIIAINSSWKWSVWYKYFKLCPLNHSWYSANALAPCHFLTIFHSLHVISLPHPSMIVNPVAIVSKWSFCLPCPCHAGHPYLYQMLCYYITFCLYTLEVTSSFLTLTLPGTYAGVSGSLDSYCSLKPLCSGMGEVVPVRTSPTLLPPSPRTVLSLSCFKVSQCINCRD